MPELALLRHGQSEWNKASRFTGWVDVDLTEEGERQAAAAGERLVRAGFLPDVCYTSLLKRAIRTLWIALQASDRCWVEIRNDHRLNERHYGALQGLDKRQAAAAWGEEQVRRWRRGYDEPLPDKEDIETAIAQGVREGSVPPGAHPGQDEGRYAGVAQVPDGETFRQAAERVAHCWESRIAPSLREGKRTLVVAHGNSLRGLMMEVEGIRPDEVHELELPTGAPVLYRLDSALRVTERRAPE